MTVGQLRKFLAEMAPDAEVAVETSHGVFLEVEGVSHDGFGGVVVDVSHPAVR